MDISNLTSLINALRAERMFLITHKKKTLLFSDVSLLVWITHKKKTLLFSDVSFGCPMGLEPMTFRTTI